MRNLATPERDDISDYRAAIARKRLPARAVLDEYAANVLVAYTAYGGTTSNIASLLPMPLAAPNHGDILRSNYDSLDEGRALDDLGAELHESASFRCPMCNYEQTGTLDHFLPQSTHPEFSILARNLIPTCFSCNNKKGRSNPNGFVHAYYDRLPVTRLLRARIVWAPGLFAEFWLEQTPDCDEELFLRLANQFEALNLNERFEREAGYYLSEIRLSCTIPFRRGGSLLVSEELQRQAQNSEGAFGANHYRTALLRALSADQRFCEGGFIPQQQPRPAN
jgi:hypothetical protein